MATSTPRVGFVRPEVTDTTDWHDLYAPMLDKLDDTVGAAVYTASTMPASGFSGKLTYDSTYHNIKVHDGTAMRYTSPPAASTVSGTIGGFYSGQLAVQTSDMTLHVYNQTGSTWAASPFVVTQHALYIASGSQTIPASTDTVVNFTGTTPSTTTLVSHSIVASGSNFTLNKAGVWSIKAQVVFASNSTGGRDMSICGTGALNQRYESTATSASTGNPLCPMTVATERWFDNGAGIRVITSQGSGGDLILEPHTAKGIRPHISFTFRGVGT